MNYLFPIYNNNLGSVYALKSGNDAALLSNKVQLQLAELAIVFSIEEVKKLLSVVQFSKKGNKCKACSNASDLRIIKCETAYATIVLKMNRNDIITFEELLKGALFKLEIELILDTNNIK